MSDAAQPYSPGSGDDDFNADLAGTTDGMQSGGQRGINLRPLIRIVRRNGLLVLGITALAAAAAYWDTVTSPDVYKSNFLLLVEPITPEETLTDPGVVARGENSARQRQQIDYATQFVILKSREVLSDVVDAVKPTFGEVTLGKLRNNLAVGQCCAREGGRGGNTKIVEVAYEGSDPDEVLAVLEATADRYLKYSLEERKSSITEGVKFIENQLPELEQQVEVLQNQLQQLQENFQITDPATQGNQIAAQLADITARQLVAQQTLQAQEALYLALEQQLGLNPDQAIAASTLSEEPGYQSLLRQRETVEAQIALESGRFNQAAPSLQLLQNQRQELLALEQQYAANALGLDGAVVDGVTTLPYQNSVRTNLIQQMVDARNQVQMLQASSDQLAQSRLVLEQQLQQFPTVSRRFNELQRQLNLSTQTLDRLLAQRETLKVEAAQSEFPWEIISAPRLGLDENGMPVPVAKELPKNMGVGIVAGLVAGIAAAVLLDRLRDVFFAPEDIQDAAKLLVLATVPPLQEAGRLNQYPDSLQLRKQGEASDERHDFLEAFRGLFARLQFLYANPAASAIAVCSPTAGDGKSTVVVQLAQAALDTGRRVLVVDTNFADPFLHSAMGITNTLGLSNVLQDDVAPTDAIQPSMLSERLFLLTAGSHDGSTMGLLASERMETLTRQLRQSYDLVIYDTPALADYPDVNFLSAHTDGLLMVINLGKTKRTLAMQILDELNDFNLPCLGVVANNTSGVKLDYPSSVTPSPSGGLGRPSPQQA